MIHAVNTNNQDDDDDDHIQCGGNEQESGQEAEEGKMRENATSIFFGSKRN